MIFNMTKFFLKFPSTQSILICEPLPVRQAMGETAWHPTPFNLLYDEIPGPQRATMCPDLLLGHSDDHSIPSLISMMSSNFSIGDLFCLYTLSLA